MCLIFDGTGFRLEKEKDVLLHRDLYSAYHKQTEGYIVLGECGASVAVAHMTEGYVPAALQASVRTDCFSLKNRWRPACGGAHPSSIGVALPRS